MSGFIVFLCGCVVSLVLGKIEFLEKKGDNCDRELEAERYLHLCTQLKANQITADKETLQKKYDEIIIGNSNLYPAVGNSNKNPLGAYKKKK